MRGFPPLFVLLLQIAFAKVPIHLWRSQDRQFRVDKPPVRIETGAHGHPLDGARCHGTDCVCGRAVDCICGRAGLRKHAPRGRGAQRTSISLMMRVSWILIPDSAPSICLAVQPPTCVPRAAVQEVLPRGAARMRSRSDFGRVRQSAPTPKQLFDLLLAGGEENHVIEMDERTSNPVADAAAHGGAASELARAEFESFVKRYDELFQAGNCDAALAEARKFFKARRGHDTGRSMRAMPGRFSCRRRALYVLGKYPEAEKLYKPALAIFEKARPSAATTRDLAKTLNGLGRVYEHEGRYAEAGDRAEARAQHCRRLS